MSNLNKPKTLARTVEHGVGSRLYWIWSEMRRRCEERTQKDYPRYGGRGIKVTSEWSFSFDIFRRWALSNGYNPKLSIDRIDNDKGYSPSNCRWANVSEQANNRRNNINVTAFGSTMTLAEWMDDPRCKVGYHTVYQRLQNGVDPEVALTAKRTTRHQPLSKTGK